ncbi:MAG: DUF4167 domain-containing protein [Alphaproteobacteria bacterium]|nr:DUF4167 domain-containing protein [Alphaproteobacteria bacterium]
MKPGQNNRRHRPGRQGRRPFGPHSHRSLESSGPNVKLRGTASQIWDKYLALARDAGSAGDRIAAENYLQHAEHYFRMMAANGQARPQHFDPSLEIDNELGEPGQSRQGSGNGPSGPDSPPEQAPPAES